MSSDRIRADVALDPREGIFLADRHQDIVARDVGMPARRSTPVAAAALVVLRL